jgi:Helix-turn-helix domain
MKGAASDPRAESASIHSRSAAVAPRLLDLNQAAMYLGCSYWTVRDYVLAGVIPMVELPALRPREGEPPRKALRRVLIDRTDLDAFIDARKTGG